MGCGSAPAPAVTQAGSVSKKQTRVQAGRGRDYHRTASSDVMQNLADAGERGMAARAVRGSPLAGCSFSWAAGARLHRLSPKLEASASARHECKPAGEGTIIVRLQAMSCRILPTRGSVVWLHALCVGHRSPVVASHGLRERACTGCHPSWKRQQEADTSASRQGKG